MCKKENGIRRIKLLHSGYGYGFDLTTVKPVVNEKEAAVIRRIFDLYLQGVGMQSIVNPLYSEDAGRQ